MQTRQPAAYSPTFVIFGLLTLLSFALAVTLAVIDIPFLDSGQRVLSALSVLLWAFVNALIALYRYVSDQAAKSRTKDSAVGFTPHRPWHLGCFVTLFLLPLVATLLATVRPLDEVRALLALGLDGITILASFAAFGIIGSVRRSAHTKA